MIPFSDVDVVRHATHVDRVVRDGRIVDAVVSDLDRAGRLSVDNVARRHQVRSGAQDDSECVIGGNGIVIDDVVYCLISRSKRNPSVLRIEVNSVTAVVMNIRALHEVSGRREIEPMKELAAPRGAARPIVVHVEVRKSVPP